MVQLEEATKWFGPTLAADAVSFEIRAGEIVGFLGPNGAGKSTVLKMISTWLSPSSGKIQVGGREVGEEPLAVRRVLGYLPEHNALYDSMRVDRFLAFMGRMRGLGREVLEERLDWVRRKCDLPAVWRKRIEHCSKGYRQRIGLAAALIHDPEVLLLDEPTHGLDPLQVVAFRELIRELQPGRAILFSSHILAEVIAICGRLLIIQHGRLLADVATEALEARARADARTLEEAILEIVQSRSSRA
jgi:ABC-2 type transport system ATP-binding protein